MQENRYPNPDQYSKSVRAGKRTYFFDVKSMRDGTQYLILTESKKITLPNGDFSFEKHKIFLYQEDFDKFMTGLEDALIFIEKNNAALPAKQEANQTEAGWPDFDSERKEAE